MNLSISCFDPSEVDSFLSGDLTPAELAVAEEHLSGCENCRSAIEQAIGSEQWWGDVQRSLSSDDAHLYPTEIPAQRLLEDGTPIPRLLDLLGPTDDPAMLGRIGPYEITGLLGQGGMGAVFKGFDRSLNRFVAIKMLLPHLATSALARQRFAREGQAVAAVVDDHVMAIHCVDEWQGIPYLVMTYSRGISLQKRLNEEGSLDVREILRIGMQAAKGLAAAHAQGIVHRDVKPANIFLNDNVERVQLMDFGLARAVDDASLTRSGTLAGTPQYMSPEQSRAETLDRRSDLFSLGAVLYAMCVGRPPFRAESSYSVLRLITDTEPRPIREINPDIPDWLCHVIAKLMSKSADDRYQNAGEVAELLESCLAHVQQPLEVPLPPSVARIPETRPLPQSANAGSGNRLTGKRLLILMAGFGLSLAALFLWQASSPQQIDGQWTDEHWGLIDIHQTDPGTYTGSFTGQIPSEVKNQIRIEKEISDLTRQFHELMRQRRYAEAELVGKQAKDLNPTWQANGTDDRNAKQGTLNLRWSRLERRYNGTWQSGDGGRGKISVHLVDGTILGAYRTTGKQQASATIPRLAEILWKRSAKVDQQVAGSTAEKATEEHLMQLQGMWIGADLKGGNSLVSIDPTSTLELAILGSKYLITEMKNDGTMHRQISGSLSLRSGKSVPQFEMTLPGQDLQQGFLRGSYGLEPDRLVLTVTGVSGMRGNDLPQDFPAVWKFERRKTLLRQADGRAPELTDETPEIVTTVYRIDDLPLWTQDGRRQSIRLLLHRLKQAGLVTAVGGFHSIVHAPDHRWLVATMTQAQHERLSQILQQVAEPEPLEAPTAVKQAAPFSIADLPLWTKNGKSQSVDLLLSYLQAEVDPESWQDGSTRAWYLPDNQALIVASTPANMQHTVKALDAIRNEDPFERVDHQRGSEDGQDSVLELKHVVAEFNQHYASDPIGRQQPPLTVNEVVASIRWVQDEREGLQGLTAREIQEFRSIAEQQVVPTGWQISVGKVIDGADGEHFRSWIIQLTPSRPGNEAAPFTHVIRQQLLCEINEDGRSQPLPDLAETQTDPEAIPLAAAIVGFNASHHTVYGVLQQPLTEQEVVAAIRLWKTRRNEAPVTNGEFAAFQKIAEQRQLPKGVSLEVIPSFRFADGTQHYAWSIRVVMARDGNTGTYAYEIRRQHVAAEGSAKVQRKQSDIAWGPVGAKGLQAGVRVEAEHDPYSIVQQVTPVFYYRNNGSESLKISLPRLMPDTFYVRVVAVDAYEKEFRVEPSKRMQTPVGWFLHRLAPGEKVEIRGLPIVLGDVSRAKMSSGVTFVPGMTATVRFLVPYFAGDRDRLATGELRTVVQVPPPPVEVTEKVTPADNAAVTAQAVQAVDAIGELQGTWSVVGTINAGKSIDSTYEYYRWKFDMASGTIETEWKKKTGESHTGTNRFTHNPESSPRQLTTYGDQVLLQAIYEVQGQMLRIGMFGIAEQERPGSFKTLRSEKAGPLVIFELQRVPEHAAVDED